MSCSPFDLRDYLLKELSDGECRQVDAHVRGCAACREDLERLHLTEAALFSLRDEEIPQRIAFVSDKIFEPSPWRRAWAAFWGSGARLGFASAAMLSIALIVFSLARTAGTPGLERASGPATARVAASGASVSEEQIQQRVQAAVDQAVAASETRLQKVFDQRMNDLQRRDQALLLSMASDLNFAERQEMAVIRSDYTLPRANRGDLK
ncbi:MAG TPA: zf-HC2 domain-containing protein [Bryobacteraceae bacterium]|jgi:anti-sigma factor RsiW